MQFIDQAPAHVVKSLPLDRAIRDGRATLRVEPGGARVAACFRPELAAANAFDRDINARLVFNSLSTPDKLDLMIDELLPRFFRPDLLPETGRDSWTVGFLIDGTVRRCLQIDASGIRATASSDRAAAVELETDIVTLMAILRSVIADFHLGKLDLEALR